MSSSLEIRGAVHAAMQAGSPDEIISGVKSIVTHEVEALDPGVKVTHTDYFNHTYMPDMVLEWPRQKEARPLYIRSTLREGITDTEVRGLEGVRPVLLGLKVPTQDARETVASVANVSKNVFVTDVESIDSFGQIKSDRKESFSSPLVDTLKANILRTGRGFMGVENVSLLSDAAERTLSADPETAVGGLRDLERVSSEMFSEEGVYHVNRVGQILQAATSGSEIASLMGVEGRLSDNDIRVLLPFLLQEEQVGGGPEFWSTLSSLMDLESLEDVSELEGLDVTRLLGATALGSWVASRAELALNNEFDSERGDADSTSWTFRSGKLVATTGPWNLYFTSHDRRKLRGSVDSPEANWDDIAAIARSLVVEAASLRGVTRRLLISAEESSNVIRDVESITQALADSYRVQQLDVRIPGSISESAIEVDFRTMLASVRGGRVPVGELGTAALLLLGHRNGVSPDWLEIDPVGGLGESGSA